MPSMQCAINVGHIAIASLGFSHVLLNLFPSQLSEIPLSFSGLLRLQVLNSGATVYPRSLIDPIQSR